MRHRLLPWTALLALSLGVPGAGARVPFAQGQPAAPAYTLLSREGRRPIPLRIVNGQEMFSLDDLSRVFELTVREDTLAGGLTVGFRNQTIVVSPGQGLASVGGRLISLPAAPVREGRNWLVPVEFVNRALAPIYGARLDLRKRSRLIIAGDLRVPQIAGRFEMLGSLARLTLDVSPATPHTVALEDKRVVIRFEADALDVSLPTPEPRDLVEAVHVGDLPTAITLQMGPRFGTFRASDIPGERGTARLAIDVLPHTTEPPTQPAPVTPTEPPPMVDITPPGGVRTAVIDPGHGGDEPGAKGPGGTLEKHVTLRVAQRLKAAIEGRLGIRVILTREGDRTVSLDERAAIANNNKADVFISLHANASVRAATSGAEVFYLSLEEYGDAAQRLARVDAEALPVFGGGSREIEVIPWQLAQARHIDESAAFARTVEEQLRGHVPMSPRSLQQAPFRVLVGANMPAVLIEMGFISNPDQEKQLGGDQFQNGLVDALLDSVLRFRDARSARTPPSIRGTR